MTQPRRLFGKTRAVIAASRAALMVPRWRLFRRHSPKKRRYEQAFYRRIARGFVAHVELRGTASQKRGTLYICNHITWLDIPVIASAIDTEFIAMDDIAGWPLVGAMAARTNTLFISRTVRTDAQQQIEHMIALLQSGVNLMLFAEGTTSNGAGVLPFRSSLFAAAAFAAAVQPTFIGYRHRGGAALSDAEMAAIAWTEDGGPLPNAKRIAAMKIEALVTVLDPAPPSASTNRRALAQYCFDVIAQGYAEFRRK